MKKVALLVLFGILPAVYFAQIKTDSLSIYFDNDKYELSQQSEQKVATFVKSITLAKGVVRSVTVTGHADKTGPETHNLELSLMRAKSIAELLSINGIKNSIEPKGLGSKNVPDAGTNQQWRRVDISIDYSLPIVEEVVPKKEEKSLGITDVKAGQNLVLENLNFEGGRSILLPESKPVVDTLYQYLVKNPKLKIEIQGHVCCTKPGKDGLDKDTRTYELSTNRAKAIYDILIAKGVNPEQLTYIGMKGDYPLVPELTLEDMVRNRRVEIKVLEQ